MFFLGILFLINTVDSSIATAKSGRIIQVGNSGTVGVGVGAGVGEGEDTIWKTTVAKLWEPSCVLA
jgi:hypothetical protein